MKIKNIEQQLRCPSGNIASFVGDVMCESNRIMINKTLTKLVNVKVKNVLEIGHGNGKHVSQILEVNQSIYYQGLEISAEMYNESIENNKNHIDSDRAFFRLYEGKILPYKNDTFDTILSINTIYYWEPCNHFFNEIRRVLTSNGNVFIAFIHKETTQNQSFLGSNFNHYSQDEFMVLVQSAGFKLINYTINKEAATNKVGENIERNYGIYQLRKN